MMIGDPPPAGARLHAMAKQLAVPVSRGDLSRAVADASLLVATLNAERAGGLGNYMVEDIAAGLRHTLTLSLDIETKRRELTAYRIHRLLERMIAARKPPNVLLAEAHGFNSKVGFPFTEPEVTDLVVGEVYVALPPAPRARRRVR
jgi:hypothetical protein